MRRVCTRTSPHAAFLVSPSRTSIIFSTFSIALSIPVIVAARSLLPAPVRKGRKRVHAPLGWTGRFMNLRFASRRGVARLHAWTGSGTSHRVSSGGLAL